MKNIGLGLKLLMGVCLILLPVIAKAERLPDLCIASICLREKTVNEKSLVSVFGEGKKQLGMGNDSSIIKRCFYDKGQNMWVEFTFDKHAAVNKLSEIFVTSQSLCEKTFFPKKLFPKFTTESGLMVGSSEQDVIKLKGKPNSVKKYEKDSHEKLLQKTYFMNIYGEKDLVYDYEERNNNEMNDFYLSDGKVKSIYLSISE